MDTKYYRDNVMLDAGKRTLESSYYNIKQNIGSLCPFARQTIQTISILSHLTFKLFTVCNLVLFMNVHIVADILNHLFTEKYQLSSIHIGNYNYIPDLR